MPVSAAEREFLLAQVDRLAQNDLNNLWRQATDLANVDFFTYVRSAFPEIADVYHQTAGQLAATWFEESNPASSYVAQVVEPLARQQLVSSVEWALGADGEQAVSRMSGTMQRAVYGGARDTVVLNAEVTGSRWLRVARPSACEFCRMLATRTGNYAYTSKSAAEGVVGMKARNRRKGARKLGEKYHDHCHCQAVEIRDTQTVDEVLNDEQRKLFRQWNDEYDKARANAGTTETKKLLASWREQTNSIVQVPVSAEQVNQPPLFGVLAAKSEERRALEARIEQNLGKEFAALSDGDNANPGWTPDGDIDSNPRYRDNCTHCVTAYELRARGYDVEATPVPTPNGRNADSAILSRFSVPNGESNFFYGVKNSAGGRNMLTVPGGKETLDQIITDQWPEDSRGWVSVNWKDGGAHIFVVRKIDGKPVYIEPQVPRDATGRLEAVGSMSTVESYFQRAKTSVGSIRLVRVDDLIPTERIIDATDPLVTTPAEGIAARKQFAAERAKKKAAEIAKAEKLKAVTPNWEDVFKAAEDANFERAAFTFGVNDAIKKTARQITANEKKQLTQSQRAAYRAGVEWYRQWLPTVKK